MVPEKNGGRREGGRKKWTHLKKKRVEATPVKNEREERGRKKMYPPEKNVLGPLQ